MTYASAQSINHYFGIDATNAAPRNGLTPYEAHAGIRNIGLSLSWSYDLDSQWSLAGLVGYEQLVDDAHTSPLAKQKGSPHQVVGGVIEIYSF